MTLAWIEPTDPLPPPELALRDPNGLVAAGDDLSPARLVEAYGKGIFPWYSDSQPVLWWSPDPRTVLYIDRFRLHRSLVKRLRAVRREGRWRITLDRAFAAVMDACAQREEGTWITERIMAAYGDLHAGGHAHSVEIWEDDILVGGLYGVALGRMFFGESMFMHRTDASKCALASLVLALRARGARMIDCQQETEHLISLGAAPIPRAQFLAELDREVLAPGPDWAELARTLAFPDV